MVGFNVREEKGDSGLEGRRGRRRKECRAEEKGKYDRIEERIFFIVDICFGVKHGHAFLLGLCVGLVFGHVFLFFVLVWFLIVRVSFSDFLIVWFGWFFLVSFSIFSLDCWGQ